MTDLLGGPEAWNEMNQSVSIMLKEKGWTDEQVRSVLSNEEFKNSISNLFENVRPGAKSATTPEIAASPNAKKSGSGTPETTYPVTVPADRTLEQMIEVGKYDWVNSDVTSRKFPDLGEPGEYELVLVHFGRYISTEAAIAEIERRGLEPANIGQLLAFGEKYPEIQRQFLVVALRSVCVDASGNRCSPSLLLNDRDRDLDLDWIDNAWNDHCRFLAFRKVVK